MNNENVIRIRRSLFRNEMKEAQAAYGYPYLPEVFFMTKQLLRTLSCVGLFMLLWTSYSIAQQDSPKGGGDKFDRAALEQRAKALNIPITMSNENGTAMLMGFAKNGMPLYYTTYNSASAATISTNRLYPGGSAGLSLTGAGVTLGEWDGGGVRTTHQELTGRVTQMDVPAGLIDHATHVAGTMIASGVDASAKGMSYAASLNAYDWNADSTEMKAAAAAGLLVSNHSYGFVTGWYYNSGNASWYWYGDVNVSTVEDSDFGYYSTNTWS